MLHPTKRQSEILRIAHLHGSYPVAGLAAELRVSDETIRRDVRALVNEGLVVKVHGAIMAPSYMREDPFQLRLQENRAEKIRIAARAAEMVQHGDSVMLDTGSTTAYVAQSLANHRNLMAVTNSIEVARSLANQNGNKVYMAGGEVRADDGATFGDSAKLFASRFQVDKAFLSIAAIDETDGFMNNELWESDYSNILIHQASEVIVVADHSKYERRASVKVCGYDRVDTLITSAPPPPQTAKQLADAGVTVIVA